MTVTNTAKLLSPEEIAVRAGEQIPFLRVPEPGVFAERALRLRHLAAGHPMRDYLLFIAELADAQHELAKQSAPLNLPTARQIEAAANDGMPLLAADSFVRDPQWRDGLCGLMRALVRRLPAGAAQAAAQALADADDDHLEAQASRLLNGIMLGLDLAAAPLLAAGLQLYWTRLVWQLQAAFDATPQPAVGAIAPFGRIDDPLVCPCCGSRPVASITRIGAEGSGFRYLACSLCSTQWHYVRIKCTHCQGTKGISFQNLLAADDSGDGAPTKPTKSVKADAEQAIQVECCDPCRHYLKIVHMERDNQVEPMADDLASLTLDLLVADSGLARSGVNLLLLFGDPDTDASAAPDPGGAH